MILRKLQSNPVAMIPVAMVLIVAGLSILTIGIAWPRFLPPLPHAGADWNDFFRGVVFGIAIALEVSGAALAAAAAAAVAKKRKAV